LLPNYLVDHSIIIIIVVVWISKFEESCHHQKNKNGIQNPNMS